eukprot:jgi/Botrbrau1/22963/Bobra.0030s0035.1
MVYFASKSVAFLSALIILRIRPGSGGSALSDWVDGIATNYGGAYDKMDPYSPSFGTKDGSCGYGYMDRGSYPYWSVGAFSPANRFSQSIPSKACGTCYEIRCVDNGGDFGGRCRDDAGPIVITITDSCPECEADHIDLQALTFDKISPMHLGRINIQYRRVECTPPEPINMNLDVNIGVGSWLRVVVEKGASFGSIKAVKMRGPNTSWLDLYNTWGSAWEINPTPDLPWDFLFQSESGQEVHSYGLVNTNGKQGDIATGVQFTLLSGGGSEWGTEASVSADPGRKLLSEQQHRHLLRG